MKINIRAYIDNFNFFYAAAFEHEVWRKTFEMLLNSLSEDGRTNNKKLSRKKS